MINIGLVGLPNSGKSALFNSLTGSRQRVANFPGITVDRKIGSRVVGDSEINIVDLPGIYTLDANSLDERVTRDYILNNKEDEHKAHALILVIDATNVKKSLFLINQLIELKVNFIIALNMIDLSNERGQKLDLEYLSKHFKNVPVIPTVAVDHKGIDQIDNALKKILNAESKLIEVPSSFIQDIKKPEYIKQKLSDIDDLLNKIIQKPIKKDSFTEKIDSVVLHPLWGFLILIATFVGLFQLLFVGADPFVGLIESGIELVATGVNSFLPDGYFKSLLIDGVIAGVGGIVVFLPHILFLFIIIYFLEDFGYLGRAAFLLDFIMRKLGLPGKAVVPLLSSHACAIPGIMAARIIEDRKQRLITMLISPLMACSARLPVYTLLIAAIVPNEKLWGFIGLPGLMMFLLYSFAIVTSFIVAFISRKVIAGPSVSYLMMELPPYRVPSIKNVLRGAWQKGVIFLKKAGTVIFTLSIIIWALVTFPSPPDNATGPAINYSAAAKIGKTFEPIFSPLGFDWKMTTALIPSFGAREVLVSAMGTVLAVEQEDEQKLSQDLSELMKKQYSIATLLALLVWFIFSPQCISTIAVMKKETNGYKVPIIFLAYTLALAYVFSFITYQLVSFLLS